MTHWVEVEELPTQALAPRPRARLPLTGAVAVFALIVLLAGGFGVLGGRIGAAPESPPSGSVAAGRASSAPTVTEPPLAPRVTPWAPCSDLSDQPPQPVLEVDGHRHFGRVELRDVDVGPPFEDIPEVIGEDNLGHAVEVRMDSAAEIWVVGGACAVGWSVAVVRPDAPETEILEAVANEARDPAIAAQNRFQVVLPPHAGEYELRAVLVLEGLAVRAAWTVHVPALELPSVTHAAAGRDIPTVIGCDATQLLVNDRHVALNACPRDVGREPGPRVDVAPGAVLDFSIEGWGVSSAAVVCGQLLNRDFTPRTEPSCHGSRDPLSANVRYAAPEEPGPWTIAISTCASRLRSTGSGFEELCGTWYANVRVRA
jgi:hypothetical protein